MEVVCDKGDDVCEHDKLHLNVKCDVIGLEWLDYQVKHLVVEETLADIRVL